MTISFNYSRLYKNDLQKYVNSKLMRNLRDKDFVPRTISFESFCYNLYQIENDCLVEVSKNSIVKKYSLFSGKVLVEKQINQLWERQFIGTKYDNGKVMRYGEYYKNDFNEYYKEDSIVDFLSVDFVDENREPILIETQHKPGNRFFYPLDGSNIYNLSNEQIVTLSSSADIIVWDLKLKKTKTVYSFEEKIDNGRLLRADNGDMVAIALGAITIFREPERYAWKCVLVQQEENVIDQIAIDGNLLAYTQLDELHEGGQIKILNIATGKMIFSEYMKESSAVGIHLHKEFLYVLSDEGAVKRIHWQNEGGEELFYKIDCDKLIKSCSMKVFGELLFIKIMPLGLCTVIDLFSGKAVPQLEGEYSPKFSEFHFVKEPSHKDYSQLLYEDYCVEDRSNL